MKKIILISLAVSFTTTGCIGRRVNYGDRPAISNIPAQNQYSANKIVPKGAEGFILKLNPKLNTDVVREIVEKVNYYSQQYNVDPRLVFAVIGRESSFRANVVSSSGAIGLGQLLKATAKDMGVSNPFDIGDNIMGTTRYIANMLKRNSGDWEKALASYKIGPGAVDKIVKNGQSFPNDVYTYIRDIKKYYESI